MPFAASPFIQSTSIIHQLDPRVKICLATMFSLAMAMSHQVTTLLGGLGYALGLTLFAHLHFRAIFKRLYPLNWFMGVLFLVLPSWQAIEITLKSNTILLILTALISTLETITLGQALSYFQLPPILVHLFLFTVRYLEVLHTESQRLLQAMKVRGFQARLNRHTYQSLAYLVGMLLVKSFDRSQRILAAMKCRGFHGQFFLFTHFSLKRQDCWFGLMSLGILCWLMKIEYL